MARASICNQVDGRHMNSQARSRASSIRAFASRDDPHVIDARTAIDLQSVPASRQLYLPVSRFSAVTPAKSISSSRSIHFFSPPDLNVRVEPNRELGHSDEAKHAMVRNNRHGLEATFRHDASDRVTRLVIGYRSQLLRPGSVSHRFGAASLTPISLP